MVSYTVAVLTVSDTAFASGQEFDKTGPLIAAFLSSIPNSIYNVIKTAIVPDEPSQIREIVENWCGEGINLILTSGGTGFGVRDRTPEALSSLLTKPAPGLVALMLYHSLAITPMAALSRPVAGIHVSTANTASGKGSMIVTLPGSPKGAKENLEALVKVLPHALELASGDSGSKTHGEMAVARGEKVVARNAPSELQSNPVPSTLPSHSHSHDSSHSHSCSHDHTAPTPRTTQLSQDPSLAASRQRHSPYPLIPVKAAMELIFAQARVAKIRTLPVDDGLVGFVLADDIEAVKNIPERPTTNVDGYAVRSTDPVGIYTVQLEYGTVPIGSVYRINTGAPLPEGTDSVIMVEDTLVASRDGDEGDEKTVQTLAKVNLGENTRNPGSDVKAGERVLEKGDVLSATGGEIGTLAFVGKRSTRIHIRPIIGVLSTGNELVDIQDTTTKSGSFSSIPDSNRPSLIAILKHLHFDVLDLGICGDTMEETKAALQRGCERADMIITTGGTSMGVGDLLKPCIEKMMKGTIHFGRVALKPGKPTTFATIPAHPMSPNPNPRLVFALPGNPASALVTFFLFALPALRKMEGRREGEWELPRIRVQLTSDISLDSRPEYQRVNLRPNRALTGASFKAFPTGGQRSSRTVSLAGASGMLDLPAREEGKDSYKAGEEVDCVIIGELSSV